MPRAHQNDISVAAREYQNASENEGPHQDFVEFGIPCQQGVQLLAIEFDEFSSFRNLPASHPRAIGNCRHLAGKCSRVKGHDGTFAAGCVRLDNVQASRKQHPKGSVSLTRFEQNLAKFDLAYSTRLAKPRDLRSSKSRKCLCVVQ